MTISCLLLALPVSFLLLVFISWKRNKDNLRIDNTCKTRELYSGIREVPKWYLSQQEQEDEMDKTQKPEIKLLVPQDIKVARLYYLLFLAKRLVLILFVVIIPSSYSLFAYKILLVLTLQTAYVLYTIFVTSFARNKDQIVYISNEFIFQILISLLIKYHNALKWTDTSENIYIGIIVSQLWILLIVSIISGSFKLVRILRQRKNTPNKSASIDEDNGSKMKTSMLMTYIQ